MRAAGLRVRLQPVKVPHVAVIEGDFGLGRLLGSVATVGEAAGERLAPVLAALRPIGASVFDRRAGHVGSDIAPLQDAGIAGDASLVDARHDFDVHRTPADTLDKVDPDALRRQVAVHAVPVWFLAEVAEPIPAAPAAP